MPPRKGETAASRKSDVGGNSAAAATEAPTAAEDELRPTTATSQPLSLGELAGTSDPLEQTAEGGAQPDGTGHAPGEKEKEKERRESRGGDALTIEVGFRGEGGRQGHRCSEANTEAGPQHAAVYHHSPGQGRAAAEHADPGQRYHGDEQERNRVHQPSCKCVCLLSTALLGFLYCGFSCPV